MKTHDVTAFRNVTDEPCPVCLDLFRNWYIRREMVMPVPKYGPRSICKRQCCFDCQSAETLMKLRPTLAFDMLRLAVGNDRQESLRMPEGMARHFGLMATGIVKTAHRGQLEAHLAWLDKVIPLEEVQ